LPHLAGFCIDAGANPREELRDVLDLVEQDRESHLVEERSGVGLGAGPNVRILQKDVGGARE